MELFTNILIWIGVLTAAVVVALAIHEFIWKPRQEPVMPDSEVSEPKPGKSAGAQETACEAPIVPDANAREGAPEPIADPRADEDMSESPEKRFKQLTRSQRLGLARLTIMTADFDRAVGLVVTASREGYFEAIVETGLVVFDEKTERYEITEAGRSLSGEYLTADDERLVREFHAAHFSRLVKQIHETELEDREAAVLGFEMVQREWPHLDAVLEFISRGENSEGKVLEYVEAVNATGVLESRPEDGLRWFGSMLSAARKMANQPKELDALGHLGALSAGMGNPAEALEYYSQGEAICRELDDRQGEGTCLGNMGLAWRKLGETDKAVEAFEKTLVIMRETGDVVREGFALASLGKAAEDAGDFSKAIDYHEQHLGRMTESGDSSGEILALAHLGGAHLGAGKPSDAVKCFERQLRLAKSLNNMAAEGNARGNLGKGYRVLEDHDKAAEHFRQQVEIARSLNEPAVGLFALGELGQCHQDANRNWKAVECFDDQLKLARQVGDRENEAKALWNAARVVRSMGRTPDAITRISAALPIFESIDSPDADEARADFERWRAESA